MADAKKPSPEETTMEAPDYRDPTGEYVPVQLAGLGSGIARDIELFHRTGADYFLVKPKNTPTEAQALKRYAGNSPYLYVAKKDQTAYFDEINKRVSAIVNDRTIPVRTKAAVLTDCAVSIIDDIFSDPSHPQHIDKAKSFTQDCVNFISQSRQAFLHLVELSGHDHYTYAHSIGVAAYAMVLAREMGIQDEQDVADVGLAGILHDVGKTMVDPAIINKKGPLNAEEWAIMKKHPQYGGEILRRHKALSPAIILAAEGHHENLDGSGYPRGLRAKEMDPLVRIVSLSDAFSALTTKRSYSPSRDSATAFQLMKENLDKKFDRAMFRRFVLLFLSNEQEKKAA